MYHERINKHLPLSERNMELKTYFYDLLESKSHGLNGFNIVLMKTKPIVELHAI